MDTYPHGIAQTVFETIDRIITKGIVELNGSNSIPYTQYAHYIPYIGL